MSDQDQTISEAVAAAFGRAPQRGNTVLEAFVAAGFDEDQARRGVKLLESGRFLDFTDVAESLRRDQLSSWGSDNRPVAPRVTESSIVAAARSLAESARVDDERPAAGGVALSEADVTRAVRAAFGLGRS